MATARLREVPPLFHELEPAVEALGGEAPHVPKCSVS